MAKNKKIEVLARELTDEQWVHVFDRYRPKWEGCPDYEPAIHHGNALLIYVRNLAAGVDHMSPVPLAKSYGDTPLGRAVLRASSGERA